jgi:5'-nucleotidase
VPIEDPMGRPLHWITVIPIEETEEGTDRWAVNQGYISITPLCLDLTDARALEEARRRHPVPDV